MWRPVVSCATAFVLGLIIVPLLLRTSSTGQESVGPATVPDQSGEINIPHEDVAVAQSPAIENFVLRGQVQTPRPVVAPATVAGEVARVPVQPGQYVHQGDVVLEISVGPTTRVAPKQQANQTSAEKDQISAMDSQVALAGRITDDQTRLAAALRRVQIAQEHVDATRRMLDRIRAGEEPVAPADATAAGNAGSPKQKALADAARLHSQADAADARVADAEAQFRAAEDDSRNADDALKAATTNVDSTEDLFDKGIASGSDVEDARAAAISAQSKATDAANRAFTLRQTWLDLQKKAAKHRSDAEDAESEAQAMPDDAPIAGTSGGSGADAGDGSLPGDSAGNGQPITLPQAINMAKRALAESKQANDDATGIQDEISEYQHEVDDSKARLQSTSDNLSEAQQALINSIPQPKFVPVTAPCDGEVAWVAPLARDVQPGDGVFGLMDASVFTASFTDSTGAWRSVKPGETMSALIPNNGKGAGPGGKQPAGLTGGQEPPGRTGAPVDGAVENFGLQPLPDALDKLTGSKPVGAVANITVTSVGEPETAGAPAVILATVNVVTPGIPPIQPQEGMPIIATSPDEASSNEVFVMDRALVRRPTGDYIAVLQPRSDQDVDFDLLWKRVDAKDHDARGHTGVTGLSQGDRYMMRPDHLPAKLRQVFGHVHPDSWPVNLTGGV